MDGGVLILTAHRGKINMVCCGCLLFLLCAAATHAVRVRCGAGCERVLAGWVGGERVSVRMSYPIVLLGRDHKIHHGLLLPHNVTFPACASGPPHLDHPTKTPTASSSVQTRDCV